MGGLLSHSVVETWEISQVGLSTIIFRWRLTLHCTLSCVSSQRKSWTRGGAWLLYFAFKLSLPVGTRGHGAAPVPGDREGSRLNDVAQLRQFPKSPEVCVVAPRTGYPALQKQRNLRHQTVLTMAVQGWKPICQCVNYARRHTKKRSPHHSRCPPRWQLCIAAYQTLWCWLSVQCNFKLEWLLHQFQPWDFVASRNNHSMLKELVQDNFNLS